MATDELDPDNRDPVVARVGRLQREFAGQVVAMTPEERSRRAITLDSPRVWAIQQVARERGVTEGTLRNHLRRAFQRQKKGEQAKRDHAARRLQKIEDFDLELEPDWVSAIEQIQDALWMADWHLLQASRAVDTLLKSEWYPDGEAKRLSGPLKTARQALADSVPVSVCPYCKQTQGVIEECVACYGKGILVAHQEADVPKQFWAVQSPVVLFRGEEQPRCAFEPELEQEEMFE